MLKIFGHPRILLNVKVMQSYENSHDSPPQPLSVIVVAGHI